MRLFHVGVKFIIVAPSLDTLLNVSGVSAVTNFIIRNNPGRAYHHSQQI